MLKGLACLNKVDRHASSLSNIGLVNRIQLKNDMLFKKKKITISFQRQMGHTNNSYVLHFHGTVMSEKNYVALSFTKLK